MSSVNKVIIVGTLGRDPESRTFANGNKVVSFSVACSESWRDKASGERKEKTEWINVSIFNEHIANVAEQYCKKGQKVYLEGQLQSRKYTDKDGNERQITEVVLQRFRGELVLLDRPQSGDGERREAAPAKAPAGGSAARVAADFDEEIPFGPEWR